MAIDLSKAKQSPRHAGVYLLPDGRLLARAVVRVDGKVKTLLRTLPVGATEAEAVQTVEILKGNAKNPVQAQAPTPLPLPLDTFQTVEDYCDRWLAIRTSRLKPSAAKTYEIALSKHIVPRLGHLPCSAVTRQVVESWVVWAEAQVPSTGKPTGKKGQRQVDDAAPATASGTPAKTYSHDTLRQWWRVLCTVLKDMAADLSLPDPTTRVRPPERPQGAPRREQRTLDADWLADVVQGAKVHAGRRYAEIALLCLTGMRSGEMFALMWDVIDLERGEIVIRRSISCGILTETTKTKAQRTVPLHPLLVDILKDHRRKMLAKQEPGIDTGLVFPSNNGTPRTAKSLTKAFLKLCEKLDIDLRLGAQVLRRSMNSNLLREAVDRLTLRSIMGHTTEQMTSRYYGATSDEKKAAVMKMPVRRRPAVPAQPPG